MDKKTVFTLTISADFKTQEYVTNIEGRGMPSEDLVLILDLISNSIKEDGGKTIGEFTTKKDIDNPL